MDIFRAPGSSASTASDPEQKQTKKKHNRGIEQEKAIRIKQQKLKSPCICQIALLVN